MRNIFLFNSIKGTGGSTRKLFNPNYLRSGSVLQQRYNNTLYVNKGGAELLESNFGVKLNIQETEFYDLYEVIDFIPNNYVQIGFFSNRLSQIINNGIRPVALSTNQSMNKSSSLSTNVNTDNSGYGILTAFIENNYQEYIDIYGNSQSTEVGSAIAHEFFGHTYFTLFPVSLGWIEALLTPNGESNYEAEIPAMGVQNFYNFINGLPQRGQYGYRKILAEKLYLKTYP